MSVGELIRLGLYPFSVLAGGAGLARPVAWVNAVAGKRITDYQPPASELILLVPPYSDLSAEVPQLFRWGAAAVALVAPTLATSLLDWADAVCFPILALDSPADLTQVQRDLLRLVLDREAGVLAQGAEIYRRLTRLSAEGSGLPGIAAALARITHKSVLVQDKRLQVLAATLGEQAWEEWPEVLVWAARSDSLPDKFRDRRLAARVQEPVEQDCAGGRRLVIPVAVRDVARGYLSILVQRPVPRDVYEAAARPHPDLLQSAGTPFDLLDRVALEQAAAACALEMAKAKAISQVRKKLTGDLLEALLAGRLGESEARNAMTRAGLAHAPAYAAIAACWAPPAGPSLRRLETIVHGELARTPGRGAAEVRDGQLVILYALEQDGRVDGAAAAAARIQEAARLEYPQSALALGIGCPSPSVEGIARSYRQAAEAVRLELRLRRGKPQYFGDLGIYGLLLPLLETPELGRFVSGVLGPLLEYDQSKGTNLVETLAAYFENNSNLAQTAQALYIHRNTLLYRLQRAKDIGKLDLADADSRLALELALRARLLLD